MTLATPLLSILRSRRTVRPCTLPRVCSCTRGIQYIPVHKKTCVSIR